jgi:ubiquinone/menaquinone biosynthesis C-methylase UbiE
MNAPAILSDLYQQRFARPTLPKKDQVWKTLCESFFQRFIAPDMRVLDLGAGYCEFINHIRCKEKTAVDANEDFTRFAQPNVRCCVCPAADLSCLPDRAVDFVFISNLLEHMPGKDDVLRVLAEVRRVLTDEGQVLILQPNIRYAWRGYWDFFDHHVPLSDKSMAEALLLSGFGIRKVWPRFLPYTTKSHLPQNAFFVRAYLRVPLIWKLLGQQMLIHAVKPCSIP